MTAQSGWAEDAEGRWVRLFAVALTTLLAVRLAALYFNGTDLFFDEAQYWYWSLEPAFGYYSKPPLIAWIIRASTDTCGLSEFCIRLPSPLIHTLTAIAVFAIGRQLYSTRTGVIAGLVMATLPGVSVSAGIISTDVPLLLFWAIALYAFAALFDTKAWWPALLLGFAIGAGLNAKYAMAWFFLCAIIYIAMTPDRRAIARDARLYAALAIGIAMIVPNVIWNASNSFATLSHTADNAKWGGSLIHPVKALEFFGAQFGVFGPVLFGALLVIGWRAWRYKLPEADRLLLAFCLPIIAIITMQAFLSRAHANWAAVAYVAASVLVTATMIRDVEWRWLRASLVLHVIVVMLAAAGTVIAGRVAMPFGADPFARTLGWQELAFATREEIDRANEAGRPFAAIVTDDRPVTAELLYYLRDTPVRILAWRMTAKPRDHFEMKQPFPGDLGERAGEARVLLVSTIGNNSPVLDAFASVEAIGEKDLPAGLSETRRVAFFALSGYKGR